MMEKVFQERRMNRRYTLPVHANIETAVDDEVMIQTVRIHNISVDGALFSYSGKEPFQPWFALNIVNDDVRLKDVLGLKVRENSPLCFSLLCEVVRLENSERDEDFHNVAVRFLGPLRISSKGDSCDVHTQRRTLDSI